MKPIPLRIPGAVTTFGQAIRWARRARGLTLRQLAERLGVTAPFVCDIEHDRRQTSRTAQIATALVVALEDLESREGMNEDLGDWLSRNPKLVSVIRDIRACRCKPVVLKALQLKRSEVKP